MGRRPEGVYRTLRFQLVAIVVLTVAVVLAVSQWLDTTLSERALERDLHERAEQTLGTVRSLWARSEPAALGDLVGLIDRSSREVTAIDVYRLRREGRAELAATSRDDARRAVLADVDARRLLAGGSLSRILVGAGGGRVLQIAEPLRAGDDVVGAAQVEVSFAEAAGLKRWLRRIDAAFLVLSILGISVALAVFLERRVTRPVTQLVDGMQRAEAGALDARVTCAGSGEFSFIAGALNRLLARVEDLTAGLESRVRQATRELADKNRELEAANRKLWEAQIEIGRSERLAALGQMAATIAHELGTPLNSILGYTQLLRREDLAPEHAAKLTIVESQVQRMIDTIRSVLDRTRGLAPRRGAVDVAALVGEALALVSARVAGRDVVLRAEVPSMLPRLPADAVAVRQVLLNLLSNAIDATDPPGTITVSATTLAPNGRPGRFIELAVRDTGHGMTADEQRRVFQPFYTTKAAGRGTGLGLAIVDHVVRAHGGYVLVESMPGQGTVMRVRLPLDVAV
ncbi:MAG TPA: ATP-binding protein [Candidatus Binatia bacterium]|nr:ATP-binding protein [Candidatus Binatia bacterium]